MKGTSCVDGFRNRRSGIRGGYWIAQFRDLEGTKRKVSLGPATTRKFDAETRLAQLLEPINNPVETTAEYRFGPFV
jgi:hypothetical protein